MSLIETPLFSMAIIAKNEQNTLPKLLNSLQDFKNAGGEIYLLDTGSTDGTIQLAKSSGCIVYTDDGREDTIKIENTWHYTVADRLLANSIDIDNFWNIFDIDEVEPAKKLLDINHKLFDYGRARQAITDQCKSTFVMCPDCDEFWYSLDIAEINALIKNGAKQFEIELVYLNESGGINCSTFREKYFDKEYYEWKWDIHECPTEKKKLDTVLDRVDCSITNKSNKVRVPTTVASLHHAQHPADNRRWYLQQMCWLYTEYNSNLPAQHHFWFAREIMFNGFPKSAIKHLKNVFNRKDIWNVEAAAAGMFIGDLYSSANENLKAKIWWWRAYYKAPDTREAIGRLLRDAYNNHQHKETKSLITLLLATPGVAGYLRENIWYPDGPGCSSYVPEIGYIVFYRGNDIDKQRAKKFWELARLCNPGNEKIIKDGQFFKDVITN